MSKPLLVVAGLLVIGALSAVFLVANMQTGSTQSKASSPTPPPAIPTVAAVSPTMIADPNITITSPQVNSTVNTATITVSGKTFPNADVSINDQDTKADVKGMFSTTVTLDEGDNDIDVVANDEDGNPAEQEFTVTYTPEGDQ